MTGTSSRPPQAISLRVRYAETDKMGVVYHANYFVWFEVGRCELLRAVGRSYRDLEETGIGLPVIEAHCEYKMPARYDDELQVKTWERCCARPIEFRYEVSRPADGNDQRDRPDGSCVGGRRRAPCRLPDYVQSPR